MALHGSAPGEDATSDLTPPATTWSTCSDASDKRGLYITPQKTVFVHDLVFWADYPAFSDITLRANIYSAVGTIRVSQIATGLDRPAISTSGMRAFHIPVNALLLEGRHYDIEVEFTPTTWHCKSEASITLPYTIDGAIRVVDGEAGGNANNTIMPHLGVSWSDGTGGAPLDLGKTFDPSTYSTSQNDYDHGVYVTSLTTQQVFSLGWLADVPEGETIGARIYEAVGTTRGALIATGSIYSSGSGTRWHDIPVSAELQSGQDYDLEIEINGVDDFSYWLDLTGMPYDIGGAVQVRDGEQGGDPGNALIPHMRMNACAGTPTSVSDGGPVTPPPFVLMQPAPNPVTGRARIGFSLDREETVSITVYDLKGRRVATLLENQSRPAGFSNVDLDAVNLPSGVYFVRLSAAGRSMARKITVVR
jgi:hypothetical protein